MEKEQSDESAQAANLFAFNAATVNRALSGDRAAFESVCVELMGRFDAVRRNIERMSPGRRTEFYEKACDLFMDRVLRLFRDPPDAAVENFNGLCGTFLKCSVRDAMDWFSAQRRDQRLEIAGDAPVGDGEDSSSLLDLISCEVAGRPFGTEEAMVAGLDRETLLADVEDALSILNPAHRRVVRLWMEGLTEREIAAHTGMTTGNVGCVISRAIRRMRDRMQESGRFFRQ